ncbi:type 1 glutamine amidotransferase [Salinarimonas chemoclinalis]|uniref:type 1 glutamine amidotransferase n=1 Tax=Salinarimonas chemoclinalis TaxID=3241599 RepID=UPI0035585E3D
MALRFLVVEGNARAEREMHERVFGTTYAAGYAALVGALVPGSACEIVCPADADAHLPDSGGLEGWDGVFLTGSALNLYDGGPAVTRQIDLMRAVYASGTPAFGSCWGLQVGAAAAGGTVVRNPAGREVGFARRIVPTPAGRQHPMLADRPAAYEAPAVHLDIVETAPEGTTVLAGNRLAPIQAAEIRHAGGLFWGVQYHPEFSLSELAAIVDRLAEPLTREGFFADVPGARAYAADLRALDADPARCDLAWRHGIDAQVLDPTRRTAEITRFVAHAVVPTKAARGRR